MVKNHQKRLKTTKNGQTHQNGQESIKNCQKKYTNIGHKWSKSTKNGQKNHQKWTKTNKNGQKPTKTVKNH